MLSHDDVEEPDGKGVARKLDFTRMGAVTPVRRPIVDEDPVSTLAYLLYIALSFANIICLGQSIPRDALGHETGLPDTYYRATCDDIAA